MQSHLVPTCYISKPQQYCTPVTSSNLSIVWRPCANRFTGQAHFAVCGYLQVRSLFGKLEGPLGLPMLPTFLTTGKGEHPQKRQPAKRQKHPQSFERHSTIPNGPAANVHTASNETMHGGSTCTPIAFNYSTLTSAMCTDSQKQYTVKTKNS